MRPEEAAQKGLEQNRGPASVLRRSVSYDAANPLHVCVLMPLRDEAATITDTLESVIQQTFPHDRMQILCVDGMSTDGTREILDAYCALHPSVRVIENPRRGQASALNLGLALTDADIVVRVDGHTKLAENYVARCVALLISSGAGGVGGIQSPRHPGKAGEAIASAMASPFGMGSNRFRGPVGVQPAPSIFLGAYPRSVILEVGGYDEHLPLNEDEELNYRVRRAGYTLLVSPEIISTYRPRGALPGLARQFYRYGFAKPEVLLRHPGELLARHLAPSGLVGTLLAMTALGPVVGWLPIFTVTALYTAAAASAAVLTTRGLSQRTVLVFAAFPVMHVSYGLGFLAGAPRAAGRWISRRWHDRRQGQPAPVDEPRENRNGSVSYGSGRGLL